MKRLLCIWLPNWPVQRRVTRLGLEPPERNRTSSDIGAPDVPPPPTPLLLWRNDPRRGRIVVARCSAAAAAGVRTRMSIAEATDLLRRGELPLVSEPHDRAADLQAINKIAESVRQQISPLVGPESLDRFIWAGRTLHLPESLLCDLTGVSHLFGGEAGVIRAAQRILSQYHLHGRLAIGDSVGAAWAVANHGDATTSIVPIGGNREAIEPLPTAALRIAPETVHTLHRLGIERVGALLQLPRSGLAPRLGQHLVNRIAQSLGEVDELSMVQQETIRDIRTLALEYPTDDWGILKNAIGKLCEGLRAGMATRECGALHVTCRLDLEVPPPLTVEIGLFAPTLDTDHWLQLLSHAIEAQGIRGPAHRITVHVPRTGALRTTQASLLPDDPVDPHGGGDLARLIDALAGRLGRKNVQSVRLSADPLPENGFHAFPTTAVPNSPSRGSLSRRNAPRKPSVSAGQVTPRSTDPLRRPLELLKQPLALIPVFSHRPNHPGQAANQSKPSRHIQHANQLPFDSSPSVIPDGFRFAGQVHWMKRSWGPERIETKWWANQLVRRDYFRVETNRAQWWWIFQELPTCNERESARDVHSRGKPSTKIPSTWKLHGYFA